MFLVSDFLTDGTLEETSGKQLRILARRHDLVAVAVCDEREQELPDVGLVELEDAETGECVLLDTSSARVRRDYSARSRERVEQRRAFFRATGIDEVEVQTGHDYVRDLRTLFRKRGRRR